MLFLNAHWALLAVGLATLLSPSTADPDHIVDTANWIALPISSVDGFFPNTWMCGGSVTTQSMLQFHWNWHCTNPDHTGPNWGNRFFGFHKQFLMGYNRYLASLGENYIQVWPPSPGMLIPPAHGGRPSNTPCASCISLPSSFKVPALGGTLNSFTTVSALGDAIVGWHNQNHGYVAQAGGTGACTGSVTADMNCPSNSPNDPIFCMLC